MKFFSLLSAVVLLFSCASVHGATAYFSSNGFGEGASPGNPDVVASLGDPNLDLHVYFAPGSADARYLGISFNVRSATGGVASLVAFSVLNPDILVGATHVNDRWNATGGSLDSTELLSSFTGVSVDAAGLDRANDGSGSFLDAGYDATAAAFYFGKVTLDPVGLGSTDLSLSVGDTGIARVGDNPQPAGPTVSITFGDPEPTAVLGDDFGATGTVFDARITVIPEPSTGLLLGTGFLLGCLHRRRSLG